MKEVTVMNMEKQIKKFMKFVCQKYQVNDTFRNDGQSVTTLLGEARVKFSDDWMQSAAMSVLLQKGFIETVESQDAEKITGETKIRPTLLCLDIQHQDWINHPRSRSSEDEAFRRDMDKFILAGQNVTWPRG
jgi:hypothetical protein